MLMALMSPGRVRMAGEFVPLSLIAIFGLPRSITSGSSSRHFGKPGVGHRRQALACAIVDHGHDVEAASICFESCIIGPKTLKFCAIWCLLCKLAGKQTAIPIRKRSFE